MRQAHADLRQGDTARFAESMVRFMPKQGQSDVRNWEWYYLIAQFQSQSHVLYDHIDGVHAVSWHPQGGFLATAGVASRVCLWNPNDWSLDSDLLLHGAFEIAWHPDGALMAIAHLDNRIRIWDTRTGHFTHEIPTGNSTCWSLEYSADGKYLAAAIPEDGCMVWSTNDYAKLWSHELENARGVTWSPDGRRIASSTWGRFLVLDALTGEVHGEISASPHQIARVCWNPQGKTIAVCVFHKHIQILDAESWELRKSVDVDSTMQRIRWSDNGQYLAAGVGNNVEIFDSQLRQLRTLRGHTGAVLSIAWQREGRSLAAGATDGITRIWQMEQDTSPIGARTVCSGVVSSEEEAVWFSHTGRFLAIVDRPHNRVVVRHVNDGSIVREYDVDLAGATRKATWSNDDKQIACVTNNSRGVTIFNVANGGRLRVARIETGKIRDVDWHPLTSTLAVAVVSDDETNARIDLWQTDSAKLIGSLPLANSSVGQIAWDPYGTRIAAVEGKGNQSEFVRIWDIDSQTLRGTLTGHIRFRGKAVWSPSGKRLVAFGWDGGVTIWDVERAVVESKLNGHTNEVSGVWHPSEERLFTCSNDGTVRLWDIQSTEEILRLDTKNTSLMITPDGLKLYLLGKSLDVIDLADVQNSRLFRLLAYAGVVSVDRGKLDESEALLQSINLDNPEGKYLASRLFNRHSWRVRGLDAALDGSSPRHLEKTLDLWRLLIKRSDSRSHREYGLPQAEFLTFRLIQTAYSGPRIAHENGVDVRPLLPLMDAIALAVENQLSTLSLSSEAKKAFPKMIDEIKKERRRLAQETPPPPT